MSQTTESGRKAQNFGMVAGRALIRAFDCKPLSNISNEFMWDEKRAVMKSSKNAHAVEVTYKMMKRLDIVVAAVWRSQSGASHEFALYEMDIGDFRDLGRQANRPNQHRLTESEIRQAAECGRAKYLGTKKIRIPE